MACSKSYGQQHIINNYNNLRHQDYATTTNEKNLLGLFDTATPHHQTYVRAAWCAAINHTRDRRCDTNIYIFYDNDTLLYYKNNLKRKQYIQQYVRVDFKKVKNTYLSDRQRNTHIKTEKQQQERLILKETRKIRSIYSCYRTLYQLLHRRRHRHPTPRYPGATTTPTSLVLLLVLELYHPTGPPKKHAGSSDGTITLK